MSDHVWLKGEIVTTGTEILLGQIVDTNAAWIAQRLNAVGINLYYKSTVGDNEERLRELLKVSMARSNVVIVTGGLGPTADDNNAGSDRGCGRRYPGAGPAHRGESPEAILQLGVPA